MFERTCRKNLLAITDAFKRATRLSETTISRRYHGTDDFLSQFRSGKCSVRLDTYERMLAKIGADWPPGTRRPELDPVHPTFTASRRQKPMLKKARA